MSIQLSWVANKTCVIIITEQVLVPISVLILGTKSKSELDEQVFLQA